MKLKDTPGKVFRSSQIEQPGDKTDRVALSETDIENAAAKKDISVIDIKALKKLLNSDNILEDYKKYCDESAKKIANLDSNKSMQFMRVLQELNSEQALIDLIRSSGYKEFIDKDELIEYINLKIEFYEKVINTYVKMLDHNYKALKITTSQYKKMRSDLVAGRNISKTADKVLTYLENNRKLWERNWGADFTKLSGGKVFMNVNENVWNISGNARTLYNMSTNWDIVILCHGTDVSPGKSISKEEKEFVEKYKELAIKFGKTNLSKDDIKKLEDEFDEKDKKVIQKYSKNLNKLIERYDINMDPYRYYGQYGFKVCLYIKNRLNGELKKNWGFARPLNTPYGTFRDVNECIRACISNGAKSIKIMACNPGHYEIADDIRKMSDIKIDYQYYSVLMENSEYDVLTEGIDFRKIKDKIKKYLDDYKEKSNKIFKSLSDKFSKTIKLPFIHIKNKKPDTKEESVTNKADLLRCYNEANISIESEISNMQKSIDKLNEAKDIISKLK